MLSFVQIKFLKNAVAQGPGTRSMGAMARYFHEQHRLGVPFGRLGASIEYSQQDIADARNMLKAQGIDDTAAGFETNGIIQARDRATGSAMPGVCEKSGTLSPREGEIAFRGASPGCMLDGEPIPSRMNGYLSTHFSEFSRIEAETILVVENLETFKQLHRYRWIFENVIFSRPVVAIYRGDNVHKNDNVTKALQCQGCSNVPVWSFPDFDPAGLGFASQLPRLAGLILPWSLLEKIARQRNLRDLYEDQLSQWSGILEQAGNTDIQRAWALLKALRMGINQESFRDI